MVTADIKTRTKPLQRLMGSLLIGILHLDIQRFVRVAKRCGTVINLALIKNTARDELYFLYLLYFIQQQLACDELFCR